MPSEPEIGEREPRPLLPTALVMLVPWLLLMGLATYLGVAKPNFLRLLWTDEMGLKMLTGSLTLMGFVACGSFAGFWWIFGSLQRYGRSTARILALVGISACWLLLGIAPLAFVMTVWPAAILIQRNLGP